MISVILTVFNREDLIKDVINSVLNQTNDNYELIIIDDCSSDNSFKIISQFKNPNIKVFQTLINSGGPAIPRNIGLNEAKGDIICFLDSDDYWKKNHLEEIYNIFNKTDENLLVSSNAEIKINNLHKRYFNFIGTEINFSLKSNFVSNKVILSSLAVKNNNLPLFNESKKAQSFEDYLFILELLQKGFKHKFINRTNIFYTIESNDSIRQNKKQHELFKMKLNFLIEKKIFNPVYYMFLLKEMIKYRLYNAWKRKV